MTKKEFFNVKGRKAIVNVLLHEPQIKDAPVDEFIVPILPALDAKKKKDKVNFYLNGFICKTKAKLDAVDAPAVEFNIYCNADSANVHFLIPLLNGIVNGIHNEESYITLSINVYLPDEVDKTKWNKNPLAGVYTQRVVDDLTALMLES